MASDQNRPQRPLRDGTGSDGGSEFQPVEKLLTVQRREELRADLVEIVRRRHLTKDASSSLWLGREDRELGGTRLSSRRTASQRLRHASPLVHALGYRKSRHR